MIFRAFEVFPEVGDSVAVESGGGRIDKEFHFLSATLKLTNYQPYGCLSDFQFFESDTNFLTVFTLKTNS
jgi:hypothetical protein